MGQYHEIFNKDKKMRYSASSLGNGVKLLEQGNSLASTTALALLLSDGWNGERVFLLGDYAEAGDINGVEDDFTFFKDVYDFRNVGWMARKIVTEATGIEFNKKSYSVNYLDGISSNHYYYDTVLPDSMSIHDYSVARGEAFDGIDDSATVAFVNYDTKEKYVGTAPHTMRDIVTNFSDDFMTDVFILIAGSIKGGYRGGGDADNEMGGAWAGDRVGIVAAEEVQDYTDITDKVVPL